MKKILLNAITITLTLFLLFSTLGCSDMVHQLDNMYWNISRDISNFTASDFAQMPAGRGVLRITGTNVTKDDIEKLKNALASDKTTNKQIELDLSGLTPESQLEFAFGDDTAIQKIPALTRVVLPSTGDVSLVDFAFQGCPNLKSIVIGPNVEVTTGSAFWNCHQLSFDVDPNHPTLVASSNKKALLRKPTDSGTDSDSGYTLVSYPSASGTVDLGDLDYPIATIGREALADLKAGDITVIIPDTVTMIEFSAFLQDYFEERTLTVIMKGTTPPSLPGEKEGVASTFGVVNVTIYVPNKVKYINDEAIQKGWEPYKDYIHESQ